MKKNELTKVVLAALVFASSAVMAESDYPAADFQPKVIFSDNSAPQNTAKSKAAAVKETEVDENFPAANYQPKVLFSDADYKHSSAAPSVSGSSKSTGSETSASAAVEVIQSEKEASSDFSYIGLIAIAIAGFFVYSKKTGGMSVSKSTSNKKSMPENSYVASADGSTGVEKYLEKVGINKTGVAKYLEKQVETYPSTGVAKYMAKQIVKDRAVAASKVTGVEKYLRDKV